MKSRLADAGDQARPSDQEWSDGVSPDFTSLHVRSSTQVAAGTTGWFRGNLWVLILHLTVHMVQLYLPILVPLVSARNPRTPVIITTHVLTFCEGFLCLLMTLLWRKTHCGPTPCQEWRQKRQIYALPSYVIGMLQLQCSWSNHTHLVTKKLNYLVLLFPRPFYDPSKFKTNWFWIIQ